MMHGPMVNYFMSLRIYNASEVVFVRLAIVGYTVHLHCFSIDSYFVPDELISYSVAVASSVCLSACLSVCLSCCVFEWYRVICRLNGTWLD